VPVLRGPSQIPRPHHEPRRPKNELRKGARNRRLARTQNRLTDQTIPGYSWVSWFHRFIQDCFFLLPRHWLHWSKRTPNGNGDQRRGAFQRLKDWHPRPYSRAPTLRSDFTYRQMQVLQVALLTQNFSEGERMIAYSRAERWIRPSEIAAELECLAVVWGIRRMRDYLKGYPFMS